MDITDPVQLEEMYAAAMAARRDSSRMSDELFAAALLTVQIGLETLLRTELERLASDRPEEADVPEPVLSPTSIGGKVAEMEACLAGLQRALADVRSEVDGFVCPASHVVHGHTRSGRCVCPACGVVLAAGLAPDYRERHLRARHEVCEDCGGLFVGLANHQRMAHRQQIVTVVPI